MPETTEPANQQAIREGKWINRPKTGYDSSPDFSPPGMSLQGIEDRTDIKYSTARLILGCRIYLGEVLHNGDWYSLGRVEQP